MNQAQELISALAAHSHQTAYADNPAQFVDSVINNLDEVDAILPDSLNRSLAERIRLLLERANREAALAVKLRNTILDAASHLRTALMQSLPSDDQIISRHMRDALAALESSEKSR